MSLSPFFNNLRYLFRYNLKDIYKCSVGKLSDELVIEQVLYELPNSKVFRPKIKNYEETLDRLISSNCSIARFGDGEITIINYLYLSVATLHQGQQLVVHQDENLHLYKCDDIFYHFHNLQ